MIALEEFGQFGFALYLISQLNLSINYYLLLPAFFIPDLFAVGYLINKSMGTIMYNFSHHKLIALVLIATGLILKNDYWLMAGLLTYSHSCFDRMIGYGLKYLDSPSHTHLGYIGKEKFKNPVDYF